MRRGGFVRQPCPAGVGIRSVQGHRVDGYSTYIPTDQTVTAPNDILLNPGSAAAGHVAGPNRTAGVFAYQLISGDFDARLRVNPRNSSDAALDTTTGTKDFCLHVGATISGPFDWIYQASRRVNSVISSAFQHANAAGTVAGPSAQVTSMNHMDVRIVRRGQQFRGFYREYSASVPLADEDGWTLHNTLSKISDPMPDAVYVGPMLRVSGTGATNALMRVEQWQCNGTIMWPPI